MFLFDLKLCNRCGVEKPRTEFYTVGAICKACKCEDSRRNRDNDASRAYDRARARRGSTAKTKEYREKNPEKYLAHTAVNNAVRDGRLFKRTECEECSSSLQVEAHHDDYSMPLTVRWLCSRCHKQWHLANDNKGD